MSFDLSTTQNFYSWLYFFFLLFLCYFLYGDYGISWDEPTQRTLGLDAYEYIRTGDRTYINSRDRFYGVGFELPLVCIEKIFNITSRRDQFLTRHLCYFLFFSFSCFLFFRLNLKLFKKTLIALVPTLMLLLTPRIFNHAFFNSKDIPFLSMYIICFYILYNYLRRPSIGYLILLSICAGWLINFRIMGVLFVLMVFAIMVIRFIQKKDWGLFLHPLIFVVIAGIVLYSTWPYLWEDGWFRFRYAFSSMSRFPYDAPMLFNGKVIRAGGIGTEYVFIWMFYTIPFLYLLVVVAGVLLFIIKNLSNLHSLFQDLTNLMGILFLGTFIIPLYAVYHFHSSLYDDWRQLYFIWPFMVVFSGYLTYYIYMRNRKWAKVIAISMFVYMGAISTQMVLLHPYEHVYFSEFIRKDKDFLQKHFEGDYWGLSYYEGLKFLLKYDNRDKIPLLRINYPMEENVLFLPPKERDRFKLITNGDLSCYYLTTLRADPGDWYGNIAMKEIVYEIKRQNSVILRIWKK